MCVVGHARTIEHFHLEGVKAHYEVVNLALIHQLQCNEHMLIPKHQCIELPHLIVNHCIFEIASFNRSISALNHLQ